jgi:hypothetical protein
MHYGIGVWHQRRVTELVSGTKERGKREEGSRDGIGLGKGVWHRRRRVLEDGDVVIVVGAGGAVRKRVGGGG